MEYLIENVMLVDGTGQPSFLATVGIEQGKIRMNASKSPHTKIVDGRGLHLSPGFIDVHSHSDQVVGQSPAMLAKLSQGITTEIAGQCGGSAFPVNPARLSQLHDLIQIGTYYFPDDMVNWTDLDGFIRYTKETGLGLNMKSFTGHSTLRIAAMGYEEREPTQEEMHHMLSLFETCMAQGSLGLSTGLIYPPGAYAKMDELVALAKIAKQYGGSYATHMRNESDHTLESVKEALEVGRRAKVPVSISHHKICGKQNWGKSKETLALIHEAIKDGVIVTIDQYPYTASYTHLNVCIPPWHFNDGGLEGMLEKLKSQDHRQLIRKEMHVPFTYDNFYLNAGGFSGIQISGCEKTPEWDGYFISDYADHIRKDAFDAFFDLLLANNGRVNGVFHCIDEQDNGRIILDPNTCIGTDGNCRTLAEQTHPRTFGSMTRAIHHYVKELNLFSLEEMIHKMTGFAAERMGLLSKGVIREGFDADLVLFDYELIRDRATFTDSTALSEGIQSVWVNGQMAFTQGGLTEARAGQFLRHQKI